MQESRLFVRGSRDLVHQFEFVFARARQWRLALACPIEITRRDARPWKSLADNFGQRYILPEMGFFMQSK